MAAQSTPPPHVASRLASPNELLDHTEAIQNHIKIIDDNFQVRLEHVVMISIAYDTDFDTEGPLSADGCPLALRESLDDVSPSCKHYMRHQDTNSGTDELWKHCQTKALEPQPYLAYDNLEEFKKSMAWNSRFKTIRDLPESFFPSGDVGACLDRDNRSCVVTKTEEPLAFQLFPSTLNGNVENNDHTGDLEGGSYVLTGIDFLDDKFPIVSVNQLGTTHKVWNMISVDQDLLPYFNVGLCAFKLVNMEMVGDGEIEIELEFYWMPRMRSRFNMLMKEDDIRELSKEYSNIHSAGYPPPRRYEKEGAARCKSKGGNPAVSGQKVYVKMSPEDALWFRRVALIHWRCVLFASLCGGAGCAAFMTGMKREDRSLDPTKIPLAQVERIINERRAEAGFIRIKRQ